MTAIGNERALIAWLTRRRRVAIGFSGGVDSSYLAAVMVEVLGRDHALALVGRSPSLAGREEDHAVVVAQPVGAHLAPVIETAERSDSFHACSGSD